MKILLTNDEGIDAPGLTCLVQIIKEIGTPVVVAPEAAQSGVGHRVTTHSPIYVKSLNKNHYSVRGTPADCVRLGLKEFAPDAKWLIAGINPGANLGSDVYQSGTVAAAREAAILGCRAIAISQYIARDRQIDWRTTGGHAERVLKILLGKELLTGHYWNVNLPYTSEDSSRPKIVFCGLDKNPHRYGYRNRGDEYIYEGVIHERPREPGEDVAVCFGGEVSVTRLKL